jgi:iron complex outermembrane recepter protein
MKKFYQGMLAVVLLIAAANANAQTTISGTITDAANDETLAGVNIIVKGKVIGTVTDVNGNFSLKVNDAPPLTLVVSLVGYKSAEVSITNAATSGLTIELEEQTILAQEIVVSASRVEESILESPVSIEKMDIIAVQNTPSDNYYKSIGNLKGVDVATSSINFQIINTRGFGSTGNTRFVQLTDGMDTQAPALNFPIGNLNGPSELDVESVELIPGASSALYGPNAFNGILLVNSKNPFEYQGLSAFAKAGVNHVGKDADYEGGPSPVWEGSIRYAKAFNNKFAFKLNASYMQAHDWHGNSAYDREIARTPAEFAFNPGADLLHYMGDEASINIAILRLSRTTDPADPGWETLATSGIGVFSPGTTAWEYAQNNWLPSHIVSITPFAEEHVVDYNAKNLKLNGGLFYRVSDKAEVSYLYNGGFGTSVYTGAQRYSLKNFSIGQHRLQLRGDNFYLRAYTTRENSGDSYIAEFLAKRLNDIRSGGNVSTWLGTYAIYYLRHLYNNGYTDPNVDGNNVNIPVEMQMAAHNFARQQTDGRFALTPGTSQFEQAKAAALQGVVPDGPSFQDATNLYHAEGQYDFKNEIKTIELQTGASFRLYDLNSNGTIFDDRTQNVTIKEYGAYVQAGKWLGNRKFKLSGSIRYDKNENFKGRVNPRISGLYKAGENSNFRLSYQTGFRIPSTQGQHIDLNIISARLLGGLQRYADKYDLERVSSNGQNLAFEGFSVERYSKAVFDQKASTAAIFNPANVALLQPFKFTPVKPEQVQSIEFGYKGLIANSLFIDAAYYYNIYNDFITQVRVRIAQELPDGSPNYATILNGEAVTLLNDGNIIGNTAQIYTNSSEQITSQGAVAGLTYNLPKGYTIGGNYNWNVINNVPAGFLAEFNTPEHKVNFNFGNRKVTENIGFSVAWRWQSEFLWESSFTIPRNGYVPAYNTVDAQVSYKLSSLKSMIKIGGSNLLNQKYIQSLGGVNIGGLYYISLTFDELMR